MGSATIIALVEGVLNSVPTIVAAYNAWKAAALAGTDPTVADLQLAQATADYWYQTAKNGGVHPIAEVNAAAASAAQVISAT